MEARQRRDLRSIVLLFVIALWGVTAQGADPFPSAGRYAFDAGQSTILQTGGFAGVHWTYAVEGQFCLIVDEEAGAAWFEQVDANAGDESEPIRTLDPNEVFNLEALTGTVIDETTIEFAGETGDGSTMELNLTATDEGVWLTGQTTPPPNSADFFVFNLDATATRKYAGGTGEPNTPYLIATAEQMNAIGAAPSDWDKHFRLTADIDLSAYDGQDGRPAFNIIAPDIDPEEWDFQGTPFAGAFDGNDCTIANFRWADTTGSYIGLFGYVSDPNAEIRNLRLTDPNVSVDEGSCVGALAGYVAQGTIDKCSVEGGSVRGSSRIGGLAGKSTGTTITDCHVECSVVGDRYVGGLVGYSAAHHSGLFCRRHGFWQ